LTVDNNKTLQYALDPPQNWSEKTAAKS